MIDRCINFRADAQFSANPYETRDFHAGFKFKEASHVILAVPFALSGGVFPLKLLGYNFSVAVWVGFIALCGTAVQTGVVMVIYLEEAVERKRVAMGGLTVLRSA